jgi:hypothetical protein
MSTETSYIGRADLPIGLRNNNPGNLRPGDSWQGMTGENGGFIVFKSIPWGVRAMATDLVSKINEGLDTITKIVNKYAPASDNNNVQAYINDVSNISGFDPDEQLTPDGDTISKLVRAHISHENGAAYSHYVSDSDIQEGMSLMSHPLTAFFKRQ